MQETVEAGLDFDECSVRHEGAHCAVDRVTDFERGAAAGNLAAGLLLENDTAINDDVFIGHVKLGDAAGDLLADEGLELSCVARAAAACGHEGANADVDAEAAFDNRGDGTGNGDLFGEGALEGRPVSGLRDAVAREFVIALFIAAGDGDWKTVAGLDAFGVVGEDRARQNAFNLVADVEDNLIGSERDDRALKLLAVDAMGVRALECLQLISKRGLFDRLGVSVEASVLFGLDASGFGWRDGFVGHGEYLFIVS